MKIKPSRDLQLIVAVATFPAAVATAVAAPNGWVKWTVVAVVVWTSPGSVDKSRPHAEARSKASGLTPPR